MKQQEVYDIESPKGSSHLDDKTKNNDKKASCSDHVEFQVIVNEDDIELGAEDDNKEPTVMDWAEVSGVFSFNLVSRIYFESLTPPLIH
ncbi:hypothetical protein EON64_03930 [archaeon]|nr:MAG: hypothetical protein EON64_03930 [archaeon]